MNIFIDQNFAKKKKFHQTFHQRCLQKFSANPHILPDLPTFAEEILNGKLQNSQNFP